MPRTALHSPPRHPPERLEDRGTRTSLQGEHLSVDGRCPIGTVGDRVPDAERRWAGCARHWPHRAADGHGQHRGLGAHCARPAGRLSPAHRQRRAPSRKAISAHLVGLRAAWPVESPLRDTSSRPRRWPGLASAAPPGRRARILPPGVSHGAVRPCPPQGLGAGGRGFNTPSPTRRYAPSRRPNAASGTAGRRNRAHVAGGRTSHFDSPTTGRSAPTRPSGTARGTTRDPGCRPSRRW